MHGLRFLDRSVDLVTALDSSYSPGLVLLSIVIASLASYAALGLAGRIREAESASARRWWCAAGALAMGTGVWAMHFIGMLAFRLPVPVAYDVLVTFLSMVPAALASVVALRVISRETVSRRELAVGGLLMGSGIGVMHVTGMAAMHLAAMMLYDPLLLVLAIVVGIGLATGALAVSTRGAKQIQKDYRAAVGASCLMGMAVAGLHYTAMWAVYFFPADAPAGHGFEMDPRLLALLVTVATVLILGLTIFVVMVDRRLKAAALIARASRTRMIEAIESISEGFSLFDPQDRLVMCNSRYRKLQAAGEADLKPGQTFEQILRQAIHSGQFPEAAADAEAWIAGRLSQHSNPQGSFLQQRSGGRWVQVNERKTHDGYTVAVYTDISDLKRTQLELSDTLDKLRSAQTHLVHSEKMTLLGQLTAGIAHELNSPLGVISSSADNSARCADRITEVCDTCSSVEEAKASPKLQRAIGALRENSRTIVSGAERIGKIVSSLKNFAHLDEATLKLADIHESVETTLTLLQHQVVGRIRIEKRFSELPQIYCNPAGLNQAFMALLTKAVETIEGRGQISIETSRDDSYVYVCLKDDGKGISSEAIAGLFQIQFATKGSRVGVDMGLSSAYHVIRNHDGDLEVTSETGKGTQFMVKLPIKLGDLAVQH